MGPLCAVMVNVFLLFRIFLKKDAHRRFFLQILLFVFIIRLLTW